ncbi:MAG TPA: MFS transporter [Pyrinomonadaceae bacterium]|jgi:MFS family permease
MKSSKRITASIRRVAFASLTGTAIEWFDFFLYNVATALVFTNLFFPSGDGLAGMLKAYVAYAVGFVARPVGGMVCGHFGDRIGRKSMLVLALFITGAATFLIGLLPSYQSIGILAPILLVTMRFAQGFGIGGEWGGAVLMAIEHAPSHRRGFYGSWPQMGVPLGLFLSNVVFFGIGTLPPDVREWAWRVPFLLSSLLVGLGMYIRLSVAESPMFAAIRQNCSKLPLLDVWRQQRRDVLLAMGAKMAENGVFYIYTFFIIIFAKSIGVRETTILIAISLAALIMMAAMPAYGLLSDHFGRKSIYLCGTIFTGLFAFPFFWMVETKQTLWVTLAVILALVLGWASMYAPQASFFSELFDTRVRYSGASLGAQVATIFAGGLMQVIAADLLNRTGSYWPVALIVVGMVAVTVACVLLAAETFHKDIRPKPGGPSPAHMV